MTMLGNGVSGCYKPTVNEPETINEAQPFCLVLGGSEPVGLRVVGIALPVPSYIERS
jgi:hypothetical protein